MRIDDIDAVMEFVSAVPEIHVSREDIIASMGDPSYYICIAMSGDAIGYLSARFIPPESELFDIAVRADHRRTGVGHALLQAFFAEALSRSVNTVFLEVAETNASARAFYARAGFSEVNIRKDYYGKGMHAVIMRRML